MIYLINYQVSSLDPTAGQAAGGRYRGNPWAGPLLGTLPGLSAQLCITGTAAGPQRAQHRGHPGQCPQPVNGQWGCSGGLGAPVGGGQVWFGGARSDSAIAGGWEWWDDAGL